MPVDLEQQILNVLHGMKAGQRPATFGELARRFGANADLIARCGRQMVDKGLAKPSMVEIRGIRTLHGLLPQSDDAAH
jgi:hypothetical protein